MLKTEIKNKKIAKKIKAKQPTKQKFSFSEYLLSAAHFDKLDIQRAQGKTRDF